MEKKIIATLAATMFSASVHAQLTWTLPQPINSGAATDTAHDTTPHLARAPGGKMAVAWITQYRTGTTTITESRRSDVLVSFSSDAGLLWTPALCCSDPEFYNGEVDIAASGDGQFLLAWNSGDIFSNHRLHTARTLNGEATGTSETQLTLPGQETGFLSPRILSAGGTEILAKSSFNAPTEFNPIAGFLLTRSSSSQQWSTTAQLDNPPLSHFYKTLPGNPAADGAANIVAPFIRFYDVPNTSRYQKQVVVITSADSGSTWMNRGAVSPEAIPADFAAVATDRKGLWILLYLEENHATLQFSTPQPGENIYIQKSTSNGTEWTAPQPLKVLTGAVKTITCASLATSGYGHWLATFQGQNDPATGYGSDGDIFYTWSPDDGATWTPIAVVNDSPATDTAIDTSPQGFYIGEGRWAVVWSRTSPGSYADIVMAKTATPVTEVGDWQLYQ